MSSRLVALTMLGCVIVSGRVLAAPVDEAPIRALISASEAAWNKRDVAGVVAGYTPDADVVMFDSPRAVGHDAIRRALEAQFATTPSSVRISFEATSIRLLSPDVALVEVRARLNEGAVPEDRGTWVLVRQRGRWLCAALRVYPAQRA